jgi:hypothetical protein
LFWHPNNPKTGFTLSQMTKYGQKVDDIWPCNDNTVTRSNKFSHQMQACSLLQKNIIINIEYLNVDDRFYAEGLTQELMQIYQNLKVRPKLMIQAFISFS